MNSIVFLFVAVVIGASGQSIFGTNEYIEFEPGNINILLTVPHNGFLEPSHLPNRTEPSPVDWNTRLFAQELRNELSNLFTRQFGYNAKPFVLYNNLRRFKLDPNRNSTICCSDNMEVLQAYDEFFSFIKKDFAQDFVKNPKKSYRQALILDIHGQSHPENRIELGYALSIEQLNADKLDESWISSIDTIYTKGTYTVENLIRGSSSFGAMLDKAGLRSIPSPSDPKPLKSKYFVGGHITRSLSAVSDQKSILNVIQCELPYSMRNTTSNVKSAVKKFAPAVLNFYDVHQLGVYVGLSG